MRNFFIYISFIVFLTTGVVINSNAQTGTIRGSVKGKEGPLIGATVSISDKNSFTDKNGEFVISLAPAVYSLLVSYAGYENFSRKIEIVSGVTSTFDLILGTVEEMGGVIVVGSRSFSQRSNLNTAVPVDVISSKQLANTGQNNLTQALHFTVPSFNASRQLSNEPATLRGLDPDHVLILINGIRFHNMAYLNDGRIRGTLGRGSVANDLNSIAFSAIANTEVLRDGASAQYGSDAIAGVINIQLKKILPGTEIKFQPAQYYKNDGKSFGIGISKGLAIFKKGFLTVSSDYNYRDPTQRGGNYTGTVYYTLKPKDDSAVSSRKFDRQRVSNAGTSKLHSIGVVLNGGYELKNKTKLFWTGIANKRITVFTGSFGLPKNVRQINDSLYPDGFKPTIVQNSNDITGVAGIKGETKTMWRWEFTSGFGKNKGKYSADHTNNASQFFTLGNNAPTSFYTGTLIYQQSTANVNFAKQIALKKGSLKSLHIGFGGEVRTERYQIVAGEEAAWENYDPLLRKQGGSQNGLTFRPDNEVNKKRNVIGTYVDLESKFFEELVINIAGRFESYNDFGSNLSGKIALLYKLTRKISLRASAGNGFRAPALQQKYFSTTSRNPIVVGTTIVPSMTGIFRNNSDIAKAFGIPTLEAEKAINFSAGITSTILKNISITIDGYSIQIRNRVVLSGRFDKTNPVVRSLLVNFPEIDQVQFFTNAVNTRTYGLDVIMNGEWKFNKATLGIVLASNFTKTHLYGLIKTSESLSTDSVSRNTLFSREEKGKLENGQPRDKIILALTYKKDKFGFTARNTRFGRTAILFDVPSRDEYFSPKILTDLSINYKPSTTVNFIAGINNIFDVYPDRLKIPANTGEGSFIYSQEASPFGFNGGQYFIKLEISF